MGGPDTVAFQDDTFDQEALQCDMPVLVDFNAEWCGPCKALAPTIDALASAYKGKVVVGTVDTDSCPNVSARFGISNIPTVILLNKGEIVDKFVGLRSEDDYRKAIDSCLG